MNSCCGMCQVVQEKYVEGPWVLSQRPQQRLSSSCSLSACSLLCSRSCAYSFAALLLEAAGSCSHSQGSFTFLSPCFRGVEETLPHKVQRPLQGWPGLGTPSIGMGGLESNVLSDALLVCFYSVYCDAPSPPITVRVLGCSLQQSYPLSR